jgi:hypothetical protein
MRLAAIERHVRHSGAARPGGPAMAAASAQEQVPACGGSGRDPAGKRRASRCLYEEETPETPDALLALRRASGGSPVAAVLIGCAAKIGEVGGRVGRSDRRWSVTRPARSGLVSAPSATVRVSVKEGSRRWRDARLSSRSWAVVAGDQPPVPGGLHPRSALGRVGRTRVAHGVCVEGDWRRAEAQVTLWGSKTGHMLLTCGFACCVGGAAGSIAGL